MSRVVEVEENNYRISSWLTENSFGSSKVEVTLEGQVVLLQGLEMPAIKIYSTEGILERRIASEGMVFSNVNSTLPNKMDSSLLV